MATCIRGVPAHSHSMGFRKALLTTGDGFLDRMLCVGGALAFSQGPEFIQQYMQRLGGHVDEARRQVAQFRQTAEQSGVTLERLITQTNSNADPAVAKLGGVISSATERLSSLESGQNAIVQSSLFQRPFVFVRHMDSEIAQSTWSVFKPALPTTLEGIVYAVVGMIVLVCIYHGFVRFPVSTTYRVWKRKRVERTIAHA